MSTNPPNGNIFLTSENLAFSMPLLIVCSAYAFFNYVPLEYGVPAIAVLVGLYMLKSQIKTIQDKKLENLDSKAMDDIARELEEDDATDNQTDPKAKELKKKKFLVEQRLAAEKKKEAKKAKANKSNKGKQDDDDADLSAFVKGSRTTKKKN